MKREIFTIFSLIITIGLIGCAMSNNIIPSKIWNGLEPTSYNYDKSLNELTKHIENKSNREKAIDFVKYRLQSANLSFQEQIKLATVVRSIQENANPGEYIAICQLISEGMKYPDYYGLVLSVYPPFILESMKVFKYDDAKGQFYGHDGTIIKYSIKSDFIISLNIATNENFGESYDSWAHWWANKGKYLNFDYESGKYNP